MSGVVLRGRYCDTIVAADGQRRWFPWHSNLIVDGCYEVLAALLKRQPGAGGVMWFAVGTGDPAWDADAPEPDPGDRGLTRELTRNPVEPQHMRFLDGAGNVTPRPTATIEIRGAFAAERIGSEPLREFGLFGGAATEVAGSGTLINRVIHPAVALGPGELLERRVRLSFGVVDLIGGLAGAFGQTLDIDTLRGMDDHQVSFREVGVHTIDDLARFDSSLLVPGVDPADVVRDLVARARAVRGFRPLASLELWSSLSVAQVLATAPEELVSLASGPVTAEEAGQSRDSLGVLRATLTDAVLAGLSVRDVVTGAV